MLKSTHYVCVQVVTEFMKDVGMFIHNLLSMLVLFVYFFSTQTRISTHHSQIVPLVCLHQYQILQLQLELWKAVTHIIFNTGGHKCENNNIEE